MKQVSIIYFLLFLSCSQSEKINKNDRILAEAFGSKLYLSNISSSLNQAMSVQDSQFVISKIVEEWVMDNILYHEANRQIKNDKEVEKLVTDYKHSLYINELEKIIISKHLDTLISQEEVDTFFNEHKAEFILPESIVRFILVKVPLEFDNDTIKTHWKTEDLLGLRHFVNLNDGMALLKVDKWHYLSDMKNLVPDGLFKKINFKKPNSYSFKDKNSKFYVKVLEYVKDQNEAPVSFAGDRIRHRILQQRIKKILTQKRSELYNNKISSKSIKIY